MQVFIAFLLLVGVVAMVLIYVANRFGGDTRSLRKALTAERERSTIAQTALREIAAGDELAVLRASDALTEINKTYTKEIQPND